MIEDVFNESSEKNIPPKDRDCEKLQLELEELQKQIAQKEIEIEKTSELFNKEINKIAEQTGKHPTEIKLPQQTTAFKETLGEMYELHLEKNHDYSSSNVTVAGEIGVLIRIWDKFCRLCNLYGIEFPAVGPDIQKIIDNIEIRLETPSDIDMDDIRTILGRLHQLKTKSEFDWENIQPKSPKNESVEDAWKDMGVYSLIGLLVKKGAWGR